MSLLPRRSMMGMARINPPLLWDREHTEEVKLDWVRFHGTESRGSFIRPATPIRVCKTCRHSQESCRCTWRFPT